MRYAAIIGPGAVGAKAGRDLGYEPRYPLPKALDGDLAAVRTREEMNRG